MKQPRKPVEQTPPQRRRRLGWVRKDCEPPYPVVGERTEESVFGQHSEAPLEERFGCHRHAEPLSGSFQRNRFAKLREIAKFVKSLKQVQTPQLLDIRPAPVQQLPLQHSLPHGFGSGLQRHGQRRLRGKKVRRRTRRQEPLGRRQRLRSPGELVAPVPQGVGITRAVNWPVSQPLKQGHHPPVVGDGLQLQHKR